MSRIRRTLCLVALAIPLAPGLARATDGHFLHGVGAINSAMGGVGVAATNSLLGTFYVNPAGLIAFGGTRMELGFEMFKPTRTLSSSMGPMGSGATASSSEFVPIPAFGWSHAVRPGRLVVGVGGLGIGGFGVDYGVDPTNPILARRPQGFGQMYSNFSLLKIAPAVAVAVTPKLWLGGALNVDWASLAVDPMPIAAPAADPGPDGQPGTMDDRAFYSPATDADGAFGWGFQLGAQYRPMETLALGASYASPQRFQRFEYHSLYANPNLPNFNTPRSIDFRLDMPAVYAAGLAWTPMPSLTTAVDAKYMDYANTKGFDESGYAADGSVKGFGWESIWVAAVGAELRATKRLSLRAGYNFSQNPIPDRLSMFNAPAPAIVQHHATAGIGWNLAGGFGIDLGVYHAFENSVEGPFQMPQGPMPGTSVKSAMSETSVLVGFRYAPTK